MSRLITGLMALAAAVAVLHAGASTAAAQCGGEPVPPDNSEVDQYQESIPGSCGDRKPDNDGKKKGGASVPSQTGEGLQAFGEDGEAVAGLVTSTGPPADSDADGDQGAGGKTGGAAKDGSGGTGESESGVSSSDGSAVEAVSSAVAGESEGGLGLLLPAFMLGSLLLIVGIVLLGRRRKQG